MSHIFAGIFGAAVGDALGVPYERKKRDTFIAEDMIVQGGQERPVGTWSDDTSTLLAEIESLGRVGHFDDADVMNNFCSWIYGGKFTPHQEAWGVGRTTALAVQRFHDGMHPSECGGKDLLDNGNGSLMRILPFALLKDENRLAIADKAGALTHAHEISRSCCAVFASIIDQVVDGVALRDAIEPALQSSFVRLPDPITERIRTIESTPRADIKSTSYAVDTLTAALWCCLKTDNYSDAVLTAVNLGDDADTVGCVTGALAGVMYGINEEDGVCESWIHALCRSDWIQKLCEDVDYLMR